MNKKFLWVLLLAVGVTVVVVLLTDKSSNTPNSEVSSSPSTSVSPSVKPSATKTTSMVKVTPKPAGLSYDQAKEQYAGQRIQFDAGCQTNPSRLVINNGASVMFDNRSGDARWIALDGVGYQIAGYGFRILPVKSSTVPHSVKLDCGSAVNVGTILLQ